MNKKRIWPVAAATALLAGLAVVAVDDPPAPCSVGEPHYQTTHIDPAAEVPLPLDGVTVLSGHSNAFLVGNALAPLLNDAGVTAINGAIGGNDSKKWADTDRGDYQDLDRRLTAANFTRFDVTGWVWVAVQRRTGGPVEANDPALAVGFQQDMAAILEFLPTRYPNLRTVWIASPELSFAAQVGNKANLEPSPYRQAAVIDDIVSAYTGPLHVVPGPYVWTDPTCPRADGLAFTVADYRTDGVHPNEVGAERYADAFLDFFQSTPPPTTTSVATTAATTSPTTAPSSTACR